MISPDAKLLAVYDSLEKQIKALQLKHGVDGAKGADGISIKGEQGDRGHDGVGHDGKQGVRGADGTDGTDGSDGISITEASIDFDNHLVIKLSDGSEIDAGELKGGSGGDQYFRSGSKVTINQDADGHTFFVDYNDTSTSTTPIALVANTWTTLPNDGAGAFSHETFKPADLDSLMDFTTGAIDISQLNLGSDVMVRPDYTVTPSANNCSISFRFALGTGANAYTLDQPLGRLDLGAGIPYRFALAALYLYAGDANTRDNPIYLQIHCSADATVTNAGLAMKVRAL